MLIIFALTLITILNIQSADNWKEIKFDNGVAVKERLANENTRTYKELQFSFTSASGKHYNPSIKIYLTDVSIYLSEILDISAEKIHIIERKTTPIICALIERKVNVFGIRCFAPPILITLEADYQKSGPFYTTDIEPNQDLNETLNLMLNQPHNGSIHIYKAGSCQIIDGFYEYLIKKNKAL